MSKKKIIWFVIAAATGFVFIVLQVLLSTLPQQQLLLL